MTDPTDRKLGFFARSLNYLRTKSDGSWAWPPMTFQNPVSKITEMCEAMDRLDVIPECECFDTGIVRRSV